MDSTDNPDVNVAPASTPAEPSTDSSAINRRLGVMEDRFNKMIDLTSDLLNREPAAPAPVAAPKVSEPSVSFEEDPEGYIRSTAQAMARGIISDETAKFRKEAGAAQLKSDTSKYDTNAESKFADLKDTSSTLYKKTQEIIRQRKAADPSCLQRPDLVWSAAHEAQVDLQQAHGYIPTTESGRQAMVNAGQMGSVSTAGSPRSADDFMSRDQASRRSTIAGRMGVSTDVYKK